MSSQAILKFVLISFIFIQVIQNASSCFARTPEFVYSYRWKVRDKPIYKGDSISEIVKLCPNGCGAGCNIPSCDKSALEGAELARKKAQGFQDFAKNIFLPMVIRLALVGIIILGNIYLFCVGHFRLEDLTFQTAQNQWQIEEDPTEGMDPSTWATKKVNVTKNKNRDKDKSTPHEKEKTKFTPTANPIMRGQIFWKFRKILNLYFGRERYYRMARAFNILNWELKYMKPEKKSDEGTDETAEETDDKDAKGKDKHQKEGDEDNTEKAEGAEEEEEYDWKADLFRGEFSKPLLGTVFGNEAANVLITQARGRPIGPIHARPPPSPSISMTSVTSTPNNTIP